MASIDWGSLINTAVKTGTSLYDMYNKSQVAGDLQSAAVSPAIDPFGADNRAMYQQKLANLYQDPSSIRSLPSYQFAKSEMERGVGREAAKSGHYRGTNRLNTLAERTAGLASQTYNTEADRLSKLAGSQFAPDAGSYANLYSTGAGIEAGRGRDIQGATTGEGNPLGEWGDILTNFSEALGGDSGGGLSGIADSLGIDLSGMGDSILGGIGDTLGVDLSGFSDQFGDFASEYGLDDIDFGSAAKRIAAGEDPKEVLRDTAIDYAKDQGKDYLTEKAQDLWSEYGPGQDAMTSDQVASFGGEGPGGGPGIDQGLYGDAAEQGLTGDAGVDSLYGDAPGPTTLAGAGQGPTFGTFGSGANQVTDLAQYNVPTEGLSTMGMGAAAAGGALGAYGLTKALGTEGNAAVATNALGGMAGTIGGGAIAGGIGATAGGAAAGAAAAGAMAGPMIPLALAMMAYGGYAENQALSKGRKEFAGSLAEFVQPRASERGGAEFSYMGSDYYIPKSAYDMWQGGDIDKSMGLFDPTDKKWLTGQLDFETGKITSRDELRTQAMGGHTISQATKGPGGLSKNQLGEMTDLLSNAWTTQDDPRGAYRSLFGMNTGGAMDAPYQLQGITRDAGVEPGVWVKSDDLSLASGSRMRGDSSKEGQSDHWTMGGQTFDLQGKNVNLDTQGNWVDKGARAP